MCGGIYPSRVIKNFLFNVRIVSWEFSIIKIFTINVDKPLCSV